MGRLFSSGPAVFMLDFRQLRYFVEIVDAGSLTRAAGSLHVAQSALSQQMASLEESVGVRLLTRSVKGVTATDAGHAVYRHAQTILKLGAETRAVAQSANVRVSGRVRVGLPSSIAMILAAPMLGEVQKHYPGILVELYESPSTYLAAQLFDERVDLSIVVDKLPAAGLATIALVDECLYFVQARRSRNLPKTPVRLADLAGAPMILTTRATTLRHTVDAAFRTAGVTPHVQAEASSIQTLLTVVAQGSMATLIPFSALSWHATTRALAYRPIEPVVLRRASLAWSRSAAMTQATECVRAVIIDAVREMVTSGRWAGTTLCPASAVGQPSLASRREVSGDAREA
jgi:LysR family transcriptional regulator, nitrogen assimilation regulatory protein